MRAISRTTEAAVNATAVERPWTANANRAAEEREPDDVEPVAHEPGPVAVDEPAAIPAGMRFDVRRHAC
jgi:hypothetical protein